MAFETAIAAPRQPHGSHAAHSERPDQRISADSLPHHRRRRFGAERWRLEKVGRQQALVFGQQALERIGQAGILEADGRQQVVARRRLQIERPIE